MRRVDGGGRGWGERELVGKGGVGVVGGVIIVIVIIIVNISMIIILEIIIIIIIIIVNINTNIPIPPCNIAPRRRWGLWEVEIDAIVVIFGPFRGIGRSIGCRCMVVYWSLLRLVLLLGRLMGRETEAAVVAGVVALGGVGLGIVVGSVIV